MSISDIKKYFYEKSGERKLDILQSPIFIGGLFIKLFASFLFASNFLAHLFAPFVNYFVTSGFSNPYQFFYTLGIVNAFPYPNVMLWILSVARIALSPFLSGNYTVVTNWHLLIYRLPILFADIIILIVLSRWLKNRQKEVLWYYWCSPILFYISYIHGQLDAIPVMLLFVSLYFLFKEKYLLAVSAISLAVSSKIGMFIAVPFVIAYLISKKISLRYLVGLIALFFAIILGFNINYLSSPGFIELVLKSKEQLKVFDFNYQFGQGFVIYFVPLVYFLLFIKSLAFKSYNRDIFLMFLGFGFGILTLLIPPMQGWYYWVVPFFIYFFIKEAGFSRRLFALLNVLYFAYFLVIKNSDIPQIFQFIAPSFAAHNNLYQYLASVGYDPNLLVNVVFTLLQGILLVNVLWIYRKGIESNIQYKIKYQPYLIGIGGDSGSGKSMLSGLLQDVFGSINTLIVEGDDMHKWERGNPNWQKYTHLNPSANKLHEGLEHALHLKKGDSIKRRRYDHSTGSFTLPKELSSKRVIILEGLHSLYLDSMRKALDLKIFLQPDECLRAHWKVVRDMEHRGYSKEKVLEQIQSREEDSLQHIHSQEQFSDITISLCAQDKSFEVGNRQVIVDTYLRIAFGHTIDVEPFIDALRGVGTVVIDHIYDPQRQFLEISGSVSVLIIDQLAYELVPELEEIVVESPKWKEGYDGVIQLFIVYFIFKQMKIEHI